ncbi:hypothetical protein ACHWQZ_G013082 [Mnemiopsis leidyi]
MVTTTRKSTATWKIAVEQVTTLLVTIALLGFATWNVRGLTKTDKQHLLAQDCDRYDLDIIGIQETKTRQFSDLRLPGNHRLLLFDQKDGYHGGLGFLINSRVNHFFRSFHQISDRVVYMDFFVPSKFVHKPPCKLRIVNCYSPTNPKTISNPEATDQFYRELQVAVDVPARYELWIRGDFNAKLGKRSDQDYNSGLHKNLGRYGVGRRNENGERLLNFLVFNNLFAANTAFRHSSRHITTRTGWVKDKKTKKSFPYFSQIDFVLCRSRSTVFLSDARSYGGAKLHSDHKIVKATIDLREKTKLYKSSKTETVKYNTTSLVCNKELQSQFHQAVTHQVDSLPTPPNVKAGFEQLFETVKTAASNTHKKNGLTCESESTSSFYIFTPLFVVLGILLFNMFNFVTWNVHGLTQDVKRTLLANDAARYGMEVVCLQETKCTKSEDLILHNGYKLILIEQKLGRHYGLGFVISPKMQKMAKSYSYISDRVAILTLQIRAKSGSIITYRIVNAYGPTLQRAYEHPHELTNFYQSLSTACNVPSRYELYIMGDFNSKLGRLSVQECQETNLSDHIGRYGVGTRNSNGEHMLNFLIQHDLFAANTAFPHKIRHTTTWRGEVKDWSRPGHYTIPVFTQIDYIVCRTRSKRILQDARSFAGASLRSDHKFVMARLDLDNPHKAFRNKSVKDRFDVSKLTCNKDIQQAYQTALSGKINNLDHSAASEPQSSLRKLLDCVKQTAKDVVGTQNALPVRGHWNDAIITNLVEKRKGAMLTLKSCNKSDDRSS